MDYDAGFAGRAVAFKLLMYLLGGSNLWIGHVLSSIFLHQYFWFKIWLLLLNIEVQLCSSHGLVSHRVRKPIEEL